MITLRQTQKTLNLSISPKYLSLIFKCEQFYCKHVPKRAPQLQFCTRVKFELICSWDNDWRMLRHSWAVVASESSSWQSVSFRVWLMLVRTWPRFRLSFPVPSWSTSRDALTLSKASLVSRMAEITRPQATWQVNWV